MTLEEQAEEHLAAIRWHSDRLFQLNSALLSDDGRHNLMEVAIHIGEYTGFTINCDEDGNPVALDS